MNDAPFLTPKTREKLASPPVPGTRHNEMKELALDMIGNRFHPDVVFAQLRQRYPGDVPDSEINGVINWVLAKNPQPSTPMKSAGAKTQTAHVPFRVERPSRIVEEKSEPAVTDPEHEAKRLIRTAKIGESAIAKHSEPLPAWEEHFAHILCCCYELTETVNVVTQYGLREGKANPQGCGEIRTIEEWIERGVKGSDAGGWMRMNPVRDGVADENVSAYRFILLENDKIEPLIQLNVLARLPLPISVIMWSGGVSYHAWVRVDCPDLETYRATSKRLLSMLQRFGFDQANKNPSRLSRLPGVLRKIGVRPGGDGRQRLIYLNSNPQPQPILC